ncbi:MAG: hypothetical protein K5873_03515 [Treponema sp.]|nr:hypothetical protein [Treponema sp.]
MKRYLIFKKMQIRLLALVILFSLFSSFLTFSQGKDEAKGEVLSLNQIDLLIETSAYNAALRELTSYIEKYPEDFDRAQKRISKIMLLREGYNKEAGKLVDVIKNGEESKNEKLDKIVELESSEMEPTDTVIDFTNLARRTVTLGEVLYKYDKIMREGLALVRKESYEEAAHKFEEGFAIKNETSDLVFEMENGISGKEAKAVVYENDITAPVKKSVADIKNLISGSLKNPSFASRISDCEEAYALYIKALSQKNLEGVNHALKKVDAAFSAYANLRNQIIDESKLMKKAEEKAEKRNPLLQGTSYISFYQKFVLGDESNPDTGIIGAFDAYYNRRVEEMKSKTNILVFEILNNIIKELPYAKIYSLAQKIPSEQKKVSYAKNYAQAALALHKLYSYEKNPDGSSVADKHTGYQSSMGFVSDYIAALAVSYDSAVELAEEKSSPEKIDKKDLSENRINKNYTKLLRYEKIKSDSQKNLTLIDEEKAKEKEYFDSLSKKEKELAELVALSGGRIKLGGTKKRSTAGVEISDEPLDFRKEIDYFSALSSQNLDEASGHAKNLWIYLAYAWRSLGDQAFAYYSDKCSEREKLLYGQKEEPESGEGENLFESHFVKKYPIEAKESAETLNLEISKKKEELVGKRKLLSDGDEYRQTLAEFNDECLKFDQIIINFDSLFARNNAVISEARPQIRIYENTLRDAYEQYNLALSAFKKENFDSANAAVESASEKFAQALDIEFSEKIRVMREETLNALAVKIQQSEYEKVLREVFALKDKAATLYYSSNFDGAETVLTSAQAKWAKVSTDPDSEIEDLLAIVRTVKSITYGRILLQSDPHYPELSHSIDMAKQSFERGINLKKQGKREAANEAFNVALTNIRNVQNVYPLNKEARLITLKIQQEVDPEGFPRQFENQYNAAKANSDLSQRLADLEDLYEINPKYPGLAQEIYNIKDSLGMFPKKTVKKEVKKSADSKIAEARRAFKAAGDDEEKLNQALRLANEAIAIDGTSKAAKELKLNIQLKIGSTSTAILSQNDEKMYAEAARLFNLRRFADAKNVMDRLLKGRAAKKSRKVIDLNNRLLKRL